MTKCVECGVAKLVVVAKDIDPKELTQNLPILCKEKGINFVEVDSREKLGVPRESEKFKHLAGDLLDINYKKPWRIPALWYIIKHQPNNEEFQRYIRE